MVGSVVLLVTLAARPNVLFIVVDDLNTDVGSYGVRDVKTPQIDRLARKGVRFHRAYAQYALCNPSRASFLSGLRPESTGIYDLVTNPRQRLPGTVFLPDHFRRHGYFAARLGKVFHGALDDPKAWDMSEGIVASADEKEASRRRYARPRAEQSPEWSVVAAADDETQDGKLARQTVAVMERTVRSGRPFFIAAGFHKPHVPWTAPRRYFDMYPVDRTCPPAEAPMVGVPAIGLETELSGAPPPGSPAEAVAAYRASTTFMDAQIGVLLDALDRMQLWQTTIVALVSDHGFHLGDHGGLWGKLTVFERGTHVPFIVHAPGLKTAGRSSPRTVELVDLFPTLSELAGLPLPVRLEGVSLAPLLRDPMAPWNRPAYSLVFHGKVAGRSVRNERWRYTEWDEGRAGVELYDHLRDPDETRNLADDPRQAGTRVELAALLRELRARINADRLSR